MASSIDRSPRDMHDGMSSPADPLLLRVQALRSRGEIKRFGEQVDADPALRAALLALARARGHEPDEEISSKRLLRLLLEREEDARRRLNPIHRDEGFRCVACGASVPEGGAMVRDHCPRCLRGLHVDVVPGDRAADCGGRLEPTRLELRGGVVLIHHRCARCGHTFLVRAHPDDAIPPSLSVADLPPAQIPEP